MKEVLYWLSEVDGIGPGTIGDFLERVEEPSLLWDASMNELTEMLGIGAKMTRNMVNRRDKNRISERIEEIEAGGITIIHRCESRYPQSLLQIGDPPPVLYTLGNAEVLKNSENTRIAIVGARRPTPYGVKMTKAIAGDLGQQGLCIVSGMARGVDAIAHKAALDVSAHTIAVLGSGVDVIYPKENAYIYEAIIQGGGLAVSEFAPGSTPLRHNFPRRNRIISGLSRAIAVMEAGEKSGSLITARYALDHGRTVMCLPGNVTNPMAMGCFQLLKEGALPIASAGDVLEALEIESDNLAIELFRPETTLVRALAMIEPATADQISSLLEADVYDIMLQLTLLELKGHVKRVAGGHYVCA